MAQPRYVAKGRAPSVVATGRRVGLSNSKAVTIATLAVRVMDGIVAAMTDGPKQNRAVPRVKARESERIVDTAWRRKS